MNREPWERELTMLMVSKESFSFDSPPTGYDIGGTAPPCRATVACPNQAPLVPNGPETSPHFMLESTNTNVKEYDSAKYKCQAGAR